MSKEFIRFVVPGTPVAKGRARAYVRGGFVKMYTPPETEKYENLVRSKAQEAMQKLPALGCPLYVKMFFYLPIPESKSKGWKLAALSERLLPTCKPDSDNFAKAILDACNEVVWIDDCQVTDFFVKKRYSETPRVEIIVMTIDAMNSQDKVSLKRITPDIEPLML